MATSQRIALKGSFRFGGFVLGLAVSLLASGCGGAGSGGSGTGGGTQSAPAVTSINPAKVAANSGSFTLTVDGSGFDSSSVVKVDGSSEATAYVSASELTATVPVSQINNGANLAVTVQNGTQTSTGATSLEVDNPSPAIASISPSSEVIETTTAIVAITGTGFDPSTAINVNGASRTTTFISATQMSLTLNPADLASAAILGLSAVNPAPGGGTSTTVELSVLSKKLPQPQISSVSPGTIVAGSPSTQIEVDGSGFEADSVVAWNGAPLPTTISSFYALFATVPAADLTSTGSASVTVNTPEASPSLSNAVSVTISKTPPPVITLLSPNAGPTNTASQVLVEGNGFTSTMAVTVNGVIVPSTFTSTESITAQIPASALAFPGNVNVQITGPGLGAESDLSQTFTVYLPITANDIVYNPIDGLLYASISAASIGVAGNAIAGIDPTTGNVTRRIWVGSSPNQMALSSDGTQLFVGIDGAASVAQVNLTQGKVVNQFYLGGGEGYYDTPKTALYLAAVPGSTNSVAVATQLGVSIYDSGVARANSWSSGYGAMCFDGKPSTLYVVGSTIEELTVDSTGITATNPLAIVNDYVPNFIQCDSGALYLSSGQILDATNGALLGTLYNSASQPASGPIVSDSSIHRAFIAESDYSNSGTVQAFDEKSFNLLGSIVLNGVGQAGYGAAFQKIVRWGQDGLAINTELGPFTSQSQLFILQSPLVQDNSSSPADLSVALSVPGTATTGSPISWKATVNNVGPNSSKGVTVGVALDPSLIINSVKASTGSCGSGASFSCDLGEIADGASATITVNATPTLEGTFAGTATVASVSYDPTPSDNQINASVTVTGGIYGGVPTITTIAPSLVQAGSSGFTLTVSGTEFNANSTVSLGKTALVTTFVSATQLTAAVTAAEVANYGWQPVTVSNPSPGGGVSQVAPLTIFALINIPASGLLFDPYSRLLYATVPSTATTITGNSVVQINPATANVGTLSAIGSEPTVLTETADGNYLYISLSGADSLVKFDTSKQQIANTIPLPGISNYPYASGPAIALSVLPGSDSTLAVDYDGAINLVDISGNTGTLRPANATANFPAFPDASHLYSYDNESTGSEFYRYSIGSDGLTFIDGTTLNGMGGFQGGFQVSNGLVYGFGGGIINPLTTPPSQVATLPLIDFSGSLNPGNAAGAIADPSLQKDFLLLLNGAGTSNYGLIRYDLVTYLPESALNLPSIVSTFNSSLSLYRFGQDGLAMITSSSIGANDQIPQVLLLRGPFVTPQELGTATAATLSASSSTNIAAGSGNTVLTFTGKNFLPGVAVTWNGSYRTTTIVDGTHVTVAIPTSDLVSAGFASLVATNPGAPASNTLTITID